MSSWFIFSHMLLSSVSWVSLSLLALADAIEELYLLQSDKNGKRSVYQWLISPDRNIEYDVEIVDDWWYRSIPYSEYYAKELELIGKCFYYYIVDLSDSMLFDSSSIDRFWELYKARKQASIDNDWLAFEWVRLRLSKGNEKLMINIWPIEAYSDWLWWRKRFFSLVVVEKLGLQKGLVDSYLSASSIFDEKIDIPNKCVAPFVHVFLWEVISSGGEIKYLNASWRSRPEKASLIQNVWTIKQIFWSQTWDVLRKYYFPLIENFQVFWFWDSSLWDMKSYYEKIFREWILCHELGHAIAKNRDYQSRLWSAYACFEECRAEFLGFGIYCEAHQINLRDLSDSSFSKLLQYSSSHLLSTIYMWNLYQITGKRAAYRYLVWIWYAFCLSLRKNQIADFYDSLLVSMMDIVREGDEDTAKKWLDSWIDVEGELLFSRVC